MISPATTVEEDFAGGRCSVEIKSSEILGRVLGPTGTRVRLHPADCAGFSLGLYWEGQEERKTVVEIIVIIVIVNVRSRAAGIGF